jgi:hypothetical protein
VLNASPEWPPKSLVRIPLGFVPRPEERELHLTEEQIAIAEQLALTHGAILDGPAGSGKTQLAAGVAAGYAKLGRKVLFASPRKPLAMWLSQALLPYGVVVQTIDSCARSALEAKWRSPPTRQGFDDPDFFLAAAEAIGSDRFNLTIVDEWQTTTAAEQLFMRRLAGRGPLIRLQDSSRDIREVPPAHPDKPELLALSESLRSPERVGRLDVLYQHEGLDPLPSSVAAASVLVRPYSNPSDHMKAVLEGVASFRKAGLALTEIGIVSAVGRGQSAAVTTLCSPSALPTRGFQLTEVPALSGLACDSFAYWLGLERRAMIVTEAPGQVAKRRARVHIALSRACESVMFVLPVHDVESDETLSAWMRASPDRSGRPPGRTRPLTT